MAKVPAGVGPRFPQVVVLVGATGDLARRKLIPGLLHLTQAGFIPGGRIIGVSLDDFDADEFRSFARTAVDEFSTRKVSDEQWAAFAGALDYVSLKSGAPALTAAVEHAEKSIGSSLGSESRRLHYLSVPPAAALSAVHMLGDAGLVANSRIIMEKPFGTDLSSAVALNAKLHEVFKEDQ
ncbi:MAG: glucose-6-phosphate dehydrogenase, partial [Steroidobacteraceae bacterium]|nr:glucose-6-phosphate dehydrogenase [Steroidobacteraceae bacterium]